MVLPAVIGGIALADWLLGGAIAATATAIWYNNGGKEALNQTGNAIANSMSDADEQAPAQLGSGTEASTCSTGDCSQEDPECAALRAQIEGTVRELTNRRGEMLADLPRSLGGTGMYDLFQSDPAATVPHPNKPGESLGSWRGHHEQIRQKQQYLRDRINRFNRRGCKGLPAGAETQAGLDPPIRPHHYQ